MGQAQKSRQDHEEKKYNIVYHLFGDSLITIFKTLHLASEMAG
jgi:hypothetical protein